jgi:tetratricopeptide (TPR) repeat protein
LEGDLHTSASRQLNLRLIDTARGTQAWSGSVELPEPSATEALQVAVRVAVDLLAFAVGDAEVRRVLPMPVAELDPMERVVRSYGVLHQAPSLANAREAIELLEGARKREPTLVPALLMMGDALEMLKDFDPQLDPARFAHDMDEVSLRAISLDPDSPVAWHARSSTLLLLRRWPAALEASNRFMQLDRYNPRALVQHAGLLIALGRPGDALPFNDRALTMSARGGSSGALVNACHAHLLLDANEKAISACEKARVGDDVFIQSLLVAAYAQSGDDAQARAALAALIKLVPKLSVSSARAKGASDHPEYLKLADRTLYDGLRKAGLGE